MVHLVELLFDLVLEEDRDAAFIPLHVFRVARHEHLHEVFGFAIAFFALDLDLARVFVVEVADCPFDQACFFIDEAWGDAVHRPLSDGFPEPQEIVVVAFDLCLRPLRASRADDQAHIRRDIELSHRLLQPLAIAL